MVKIRQAIVVEGKYDQNTLSQLVDTTIFQTHGFGVMHAYIPDIPGKEKRKRAPGKEGLLGVEGMTKEILLEALSNAGADLGGEPVKKKGDGITKLDLYTAGLSGRPDSQKKREAFLSRLRFPAHMSANALLDALNLLYTREEFLLLFEETT